MGWEGNGILLLNTCTDLFAHVTNTDIRYYFLWFRIEEGAAVAQCVKRWRTDLADRVRSSLDVKSSHP